MAPPNSGPSTSVSAVVPPPIMEPKSGAPAAKKLKLDKNAKPRAHALLHIHAGNSTRAQISEELWSKVFNAFNLKIQLAVIGGIWDPEF